MRKELEGVRSINESLEGVIGTLERAGGNMSVRYMLLYISLVVILVLIVPR